MTLKEIAREAEVSISTVSRVINKDSTNAASKEVQDRIWKIIRRTGCAPNTTARSLKTGAARAADSPTRPIACLYVRTKDSNSDLFFSTLARNIKKETFKHSYVLEYSFTGIDVHHPNTFRLITDNHVDGAMVLGRYDKQILSLLKKYFNCVAYTRFDLLEAKCGQVICDEYQASLATMNTLLRLNHTRIGFIGETRFEDRYTGYCAALNARNLRLAKSYIVNVPLSSERGYEGARELLSRKTDASAVFCCNDNTAIGAMRAAKRAGLVVPDDLSVISIDDIDTTQYLPPMLTTIHIPVEEIGQMTAKTLVDRIEEGHKLPIKMNLPLYLTNRENYAPYTEKTQGPEYRHTMPKKED